jgi:opacity protein-like surface antigen
MKISLIFLSAFFCSNVLALENAVEHSGQDAALSAELKQDPVSFAKKTPMASASSSTVEFKPGYFLELALGGSGFGSRQSQNSVRTRPGFSGLFNVGYLGKLLSSPIVLGMKAGFGVYGARVKKGATTVNLSSGDFAQKSITGTPFGGDYCAFNLTSVLGLTVSRVLAYIELGWALHCIGAGVHHFSEPLKTKSGQTVTQFGANSWRNAFRIGAGGSFKITPSLSLGAVYYRDFIFVGRFSNQVMGTAQYSF